MWLLICAFVLAAAVGRSRLAGRAAAFLVSGASSVRQLVHFTTAALVATAFAVPATSGRAALALPVFLALARVLADRARLVVMLALLFPTVILLSAVATLIGAGAHLITVSVLWESTGEEIGFARWLLLGLPLAIASSHLAGGGGAADHDPAGRPPRRPVARCSWAPSCCCGAANPCTRCRRPWSR